MPSKLSRLTQTLGTDLHYRSTGRVIGVKGQALLVQIPQAAIGDLCTIKLRNGKSTAAEIVGFKEDTYFVTPFSGLQGVFPGAIVENSGSAPQLAISNHLIGSVVDALGRPFSEAAADQSNGARDEAAQQLTTSPVRAPAPNPLTRKPVTECLETGISSIDTLLSLGYGQRIGLFAGAGTGKSTLLGSIARNAAVDLTVIALVGERGREVNEFIESALGAEGLRRSIVVVSTSAESPVKRRLAALSATAYAEYFRNQGLRVLLLVDSLTRLARAIREISIAAGEPPVQRGYTPSVYTELPQLLERSGNNDRGSITALYTVLTTDDYDPLGEEIKSLLDGHIVLSQQLAAQGVRPAIDPTASVSRLFSRLHSADYLLAAGAIQELLARLKRDRDIILFGGTPDRELQAALTIWNRLKTLLSQRPQENRPAEESRRELLNLAALFQAQRREPITAAK